MKWYAAKTGNIHDQGLIIDEETGENIAVVYDNKNTPMLAKAPELFDNLKQLLEWCQEYTGPTMPNTPHEILRAAYNVISEVEGN